MIDGIRVRKVYSTPFYQGFRCRLFNYLSFMWRAIRSGLRENKSFDIIFASSPSLFVGLAGAALSRLKKSPFVLEVRDLWPQSAVATGFLKNPILIWLSRRLERCLYQRASAIVCLTGGIAKAVEQSITAPAKVHVVPNGVDAELFLADGREEALGIIGRDEGEVIAMYAGAHGINNALDTVIEAAFILRAEKVRFVLIGEGDQTARLLARAEALGLRRVAFLGEQPRQRVPSLLQIADVLLWPVLWDEKTEALKKLKEGVVPNKLYDYLAAGKPIVTSVPNSGEAAKLIERYGTAEFAYPSGEGIAAALMRLLESGRVGGDCRAHRAFIEAHSRKQRAAVLLQVFEEVSRRRNVHQRR